MQKERGREKMLTRKRAIAAVNRGADARKRPKRSGFFCPQLLNESFDAVKGDP